VYLAEKTNSDEDLGTYRRHKNKLKSMVRQAKIDYLRSSISRARSSPRMAAQMWSHINSVIGRPYQKQAGVTPLASLDSINEFFQTVAVSDSHEAASKFSLEDINDNNTFEFNKMMLLMLLMLF